MEKIQAYGICLYKYEQNTIKVLLCKSVKSKDRWGFLKGVALKNELIEETALREFEEECGISISYKDLEKFFIQKNELKDIGLYTVNADNISHISKYFEDEVLNKKYLSSENSAVEFFDINNLPLIKKKQQIVMKEIISFLKTLKK
ncbi:MAG: NUDIX domain-containing protein [Arcobacteraceae bacterium]